jgi:Asp-tRNA(Asn)/Glu-tRNA(Gln) amidotransferase B subunit
MEQGSWSWTNFTVGGSKYLSEKARRRWGLNFTSIRSVPRVIDYKVARQVMVFEQDGVVEYETRSFDFGFEWNSGTKLCQRERRKQRRVMPEPKPSPSGCAMTTLSSRTNRCPIWYFAGTGE